MQATSTTFTCPHCDHKIEVHDANDGDIITCTNNGCRQQFQAEIPRAHPEPHLIVPNDFREPPESQREGDENEQRRPDMKGPDPTVAPPAEATGTSVSAEEQPEILAIYHSPLFRRHPIRFTINLALIFLGMTLLVTAAARGSMLAAVIGLFPLLLGLARQLNWWWRSRQTTLTITTRGIVITEGLFNTNTREIYHEMVKGIHIFQPPLCKMMHCGALLLVFGDEDEEIYMDSISDPHKVAEQIRQQAHK